jgi:hypothetical protein
VGGTFGGEKHYDILNTYNSHKPLARNYAIKPSDAYCAATASAAWIRAGVASIAPLEVSVPKMVTLAQSAGIWMESDSYVPKPGDAVVYDWEDGSNYASTDNKGYPDHVGIVVDVANGVISVIEGNKGSAHMIGRRDLAINGRYIRGFITPDYAKIAEPEKTVTDIAKEVIAGKWGNGAERKRRLTEAGWNYDAVQAEVNRLLKGDKPAKVLPAKSFSIAVAGKYTSKAELTLRCGPGTGYTSVKTLAKGTTVRCYGFYSKVDGVRWLYVRATAVGTVGYADERLLSR